MTHLYILAVLCLIVAASEWLVRRTRLRSVGAALLVIVLTALVANLGGLPTGAIEADPVPVYDGILVYVVPLSVFWLLLSTRMRDLVQAGMPLVMLFLVGAAAAAGGVMAGMWAVDGVAEVGPRYDALGGLFVATFTGGSANLSAVADGYDVMRGGALYGAAGTVENVMIALWMVVTLALPRLLLPIWPRKAFAALRSGARPVDTGVRSNTESVHPMHLGLVLAMGFIAVWLADGAAAWLTTRGIPVPTIILLAVFALVLAQLPMVARLQGPRLLGMFGIYLFLAVLGAFCDVTALVALGPLGVTLFLLALIAVAVHGGVLFVAARFMKADVVLAAVVSQATIGSGPSALALARGLGRSDLALPAVLLGAVGYGVGPFLGVWAARQLLPLLVA